MRLVNLRNSVQYVILLPCGNCFQLGKLMNPMTATTVLTSVETTVAGRGLTAASSDTSCARKVNHKICDVFKSYTRHTKNFKMLNLPKIDLSRFLSSLLQCTALGKTRKPENPCLFYHLSRKSSRIHYITKLAEGWNYGPEAVQHIYKITFCWMFQFMPQNPC